MQYISIFESLVIGYLAIGLIFLIFSAAHQEKLLRRWNNNRMPPEIIAHLKNAPDVKKTVIFWPKALKWLTELEDLLEKMPPLT